MDIVNTIYTEASVSGYRVAPRTPGLDITVFEHESLKDTELWFYAAPGGIMQWKELIFKEQGYIEFE